MSIIYLISTIRKNGKGVFYIGSSINDDQRWVEHLCAFRKGKHGNPYLQNLYNTGHDLTFEVLECLGDIDLTKTQQREQEWIESFNALSSKDFANVREACGGCRENQIHRSTAQYIYGPRKPIHRSGLQLRRIDDVPYNWK